MDIFGADAHKAFDVGAWAAALGLLATIAALIAFFSLVLPWQLFIARTYGPRRPDRAQWDQLMLGGWICVGAASIAVFVRVILGDRPSWIDIYLVAVMTGASAAAAMAWCWSTLRSYSWLAEDPGGADLSRGCRVLVSMRLGRRDYAVTTWSAGLIAAVGAGFAAIPAQGAAAALGTAAVAWLWLVLLVLARRVATQLDPLTAVVRAYRAASLFQRDGWPGLGARLTTEPWDLSSGVQAELRGRLFKCADLRLSRLVRALPPASRDQHRRGCGELLTDFAAADTDGLMRRVFVACVSGPLPVSGQDPDYQLGAAQKPWSTAARTGALAVGVASAVAGALEAARKFSSM